MAKTEPAAPARVDHVVSAILVVRNQRVILDSDLAALYGVTTKALNQAVKRNTARFPADFLFRLTSNEVYALNRSQSVTGSQKHRDPRFPPFAFTEHGAIMAATILNSTRAVEMSLYVVRAFVQLRELLASNTELARRLDELERQLEGHDAAITAILSAIRELMNPPLAFVEREVSKSLHAAGTPASVLKDVKSRAASDTVKLVTFHSSKGLEFPVVAIPGFGFLPDDREDEEQELRLPYVAMTRAMDELIMTHHRESAFVQRVAASRARRLDGWR
jgi:superfamily I DNA/RNA helicase